MAKKIVTQHRVKFNGKLLPPGQSLDVAELGMSEEQLVRLHEKGAIKVVEAEEVPAEDTKETLKAEAGKANTAKEQKAQESKDEPKVQDNPEVKAKADAGKSGGSPGVVGAKQAPTSKP